MLRNSLFSQSVTQSFNPSLLNQTHRTSSVLVSMTENDSVSEMEFDFDLSESLSH